MDPGGRGAFASQFHGFTVNRGEGVPERQGLGTRDQGLGNARGFGPCSYFYCALQEEIICKRDGESFLAVDRREFEVSRQRSGVRDQRSLVGAPGLYPNRSGL